MIRRSQLLQSGVVVNDGPTLDEIHAEEKAAAAAAEVKKVDVLAAAEASADISEVRESDLDQGQQETSEDVKETAMEDSQGEDAKSSVSEIDYDSMTISELKDLLKEAGKPVSGKKADLISRLKE